MYDYESTKIDKKLIIVLIIVVVLISILPDMYYFCNNDVLVFDFSGYTDKF